MEKSTLTKWLTKSKQYKSRGKEKNSTKRQRINFTATLLEDENKSKRAHDLRPPTSDLRLWRTEVTSPTNLKGTTFVRPIRHTRIPLNLNPILRELLNQFSARSAIPRKVTPQVRKLMNLAAGLTIIITMMVTEIFRTWSGLALSCAQVIRSHPSSFSFSWKFLFLQPFSTAELMFVVVEERERRERLRDLAVFERLHGNTAKTSPALAVKKVLQMINCSPSLWSNKMRLYRHLFNWNGFSLCKGWILSWLLLSSSLW